MHETAQNGVQIYTELISLNWNYFIMLVNLGIIYLILRKFLFNPIRNLIVKRQETVADAYRDAEHKNLQADTLKSEYEKKLEDIKAESRDIIQAAKIKADNQADLIITEAKTKATDLLKKAEVEIERDKVKAVADLKSEISGIAIFAAEKILEKEIDDKEYNVMIDKIIAEAGNSKWQD